MAVIIRDLAKEDKPQWLELWKKYRAFYASTGVPSDLPEEVTNTTFDRFFDPNEPMACLVAENEETKDLVGIAQYLWHRNTWAIEDSIYLNDLYVDEEKRCGGVGRKLIEALYKVADEKNMPKVYWMTQHFNHRAQLLYTKVGVRDGMVTYSRPSK